MPTKNWCCFCTEDGKIFLSKKFGKRKDKENNMTSRSDKAFEKARTNIEIRQLQGEPTNMGDFFDSFVEEVEKMVISEVTQDMPTEISEKYVEDTEKEAKMAEHYAKMAKKYAEDAEKDAKMAEHYAELAQLKAVMAKLKKLTIQRAKKNYKLGKYNTVEIISDISEALSVSYEQAKEIFEKEVVE